MGRWKRTMSLSDKHHLRDDEIRRAKKAARKRVKWRRRARRFVAENGCAPHKAAWQMR